MTAPLPSRLTRLEIIRISRGIDPRDLVRESGYSRQHILRVRTAEADPTRACMAALVSALSRLALELFRPEDVFELRSEESGAWTPVSRDRAAAEIESWSRERKAIAAALAVLTRYAREQWPHVLRAQFPGPVAPIIRALIFEAHALIETDRDASLARLQCALQLAPDLVDSDDARALLIGRAWLEIAAVHHRERRASDALAALDSAEAQFEGRPICTDQLGQSWLLRGTLAFESGAFADALRHLHRAVNIFAAVSDAPRIATVRVVQASIAFALGRVDEARDLWLSTLRPFGAVRDRKMLALVRLDLGWCAISTGDYTAARGWLSKAVVHLKDPDKLARARWGLGLVEPHLGDRSAAIQHFQAARAAYQRARQLHDSARVGLDMLQFLLTDPADQQAAIDLALDLQNLLHHAEASHEAISLMRRIGDDIRSGTPNAREFDALRPLLTSSATRAPSRAADTPATQSLIAQSVAPTASIPSTTTAATMSTAAATAPASEPDEPFAMLRSADVWSAEVTAAPQSLALLDDVAARIADEERLAATLVPQLLSGRASTWRNHIAGVDAHTIGFVRQLLVHADSLLGSAPADAVEACALAVEIADAITVQHSSFDLVLSTRAHAAREHAFALFYVGRFVDALAAVERAEQLFAQVALPEFELARVALVRAAIYRATERVEEAIPLTRNAAQTFAAFGDRTRFIKARMTEGTMLFSRGAIGDALGLWRALEDEMAGTRDVSFGMLLHNIGRCHRNLGDLDDAQTYFQRATELYEQLGCTTEHVRTRWAIAQLLVARSRFDEALPILRDVWNSFAQLHVEGDAALAALEVVEVLLVLDQPGDVPAICRKILDRFSRNNMTSAAVIALAFLREAIAAGRATPPLVRHVHDFIEHIVEFPSRPFSSPLTI